MKAASTSPVEFRMMSRDDVPQLLAIERASFRAPWDEQRFLEGIDSRSGSKCVVLEQSGNVVAYFIVEVHARNMHISNLAVHPQHRRRGYACRCLTLIDQLALKAFEIARSREPAALQPVTKPGAPKGGAASEGTSSDALPAREGDIYLEVEETNLPAQLLYRKMGYRAVEILRNFYANFREDGYKMVRKVPIPSVEAARG